jgi:hypothetical protein
MQSKRKDGAMPPQYALMINVDKIKESITIWWRPKKQKVFRNPHMTEISSKSRRVSETQLGPV